MRIKKHIFLSKFTLFLLQICYVLLAYQLANFFFGDDAARPERGRWMTRLPAGAGPDYPRTSGLDHPEAGFRDAWTCRTPHDPWGAHHLPFHNDMPGDGWGHGAHQPCQWVRLWIRDLVSRSEKRERRKAMTGEWGKNSPSSPYFPNSLYYLRI